MFCWKNVSSFCSAKATHIFSAKNIRILYIEYAKTVNVMTLNELVKLTTLWTTGPWLLSNAMQVDLGLHCSLFHEVTFLILPHMLIGRALFMSLLDYVIEDCLGDVEGWLLRCFVLKACTDGKFVSVFQKISLIHAIFLNRLVSSCLWCWWTCTEEHPSLCNAWIKAQGLNTLQ